MRCSCCSIREARRPFATPGPWLALAVALLIASPHVLWLFQTDFLPFAYASHRATAVHGWFDHVRHPAMFAASQIFFLLPSLFIAAALFWPKAASLPPLQARTPDAFDRRIVTLLAFGPGLAMIALTAVSGRGAVAMWGYPLWLFVGLWIVMRRARRSMPARLNAHRRRLGFGLCDLCRRLRRQLFGAALHRSPLPRRAVPRRQARRNSTQRFHTATGAPLRYVIGSMWDGGNLAHYSPDQPQVLIDGAASPRAVDRSRRSAHRTAPSWCGRRATPTQLPAQFAAVAPNAAVGVPFDLPMRRGAGAIHVGWAILKPQ